MARASRRRPGGCPPWPGAKWTSPQDSYSCAVQELVNAPIRLERSTGRLPGLLLGVMLLLGAAGMSPAADPSTAKPPPPAASPGGDAGVPFLSFQGVVSSINAAAGTLAVTTPRGETRQVRCTAATLDRSGGTPVKLSSLKPGTKVLVRGRSGADGVLEAAFLTQPRPIPLPALQPQTAKPAAPTDKKN